MTDVLDHARETVLNTGRGLDEQSVLGVLTLDQERLGEALALAHEVRLRWCGPEVEVEGIVSVKTGGCPEDCHFCSQSGRFDTTVRATRLDIPSLVQAARQTAQTGATEFCIVAAVRGPDARLMAQVRDGIKAIQDEVEINVACSLGILDPEQAAGARRDGRAPLQPQPRDRALLLPAGRHHPHLGGALGHAPAGAFARHGGVLRRDHRDGGDAASSAPSWRCSWPSWTPTRCR